MLNPFPHFLVYSFFVPMLLRFAVSLAFIFISYRVVSNRKAITALTLPLIGHAREWMIFASASLTMLVAFFLFIGYATQWMALTAMLLALKYALLPKRYNAVRPLSRDAFWFILVICFTLLISGAGAFASDIPL